MFVNGRGVVPRPRINRTAQETDRCKCARKRERERKTDNNEKEKKRAGGDGKKTNSLQNSISLSACLCSLM